MGRRPSDATMANRLIRQLDEDAHELAITEQSEQIHTLAELDRNETVLYRDSHHELLDDSIRSGSKRHLYQTLGHHIRMIGTEWDPEMGTTRLDAAIRSMFAQAREGGRSAAAALALLLERGWGKVPLEPESDIRTIIEDKLRELGLSAKDFEREPLVLSLFSRLGIDVSVVAALPAPTSVSPVDDDRKS